MLKTPNFAAFILTHGRPDRVITYETLRRSGYTGKIYLVIDDLDKSREEYEKRFPGEVIVFDKKEAERLFDPGDNFKTYRGVLYARNANFKIARDLGIKYFIQLDDDYRHFQFRFNDKFSYAPRVLKDLDTVFDALVEFLEASRAYTVTISQGGDFIGGEESARAEAVKLERKAMNSFVCSVDRPFTFDGRINEDVNAYVSHGSRGHLFFMTNQLSLEQIQTQSNAGGMTELYLDSGTYVKSFYSVMFHPSSVTVELLRDRSSRLHHKIKWGLTVPKIIRETHKKS